MPEANRKKVPRIIEALKAYVEGAANETVERRNFRKRRQYAEEAFDDFVIALRDLMKTCNHCSDECSQKALRDQIIEGLRDADTVEELLRQKNLTLDQTIQVCRIRESAKNQRIEIEGSDSYSPILNATSTYKVKKSEHQEEKRQQKKMLKTCFQ